MPPRRSIPPFVAVFLAIVVLLSSARGPTDLDFRLTAVAGGQGFNLASWEIATLTARVGEAMLHPAGSDRIGQVQEYVKVTAAAGRAHQELDAEWARSAVSGSPSDLAKPRSQVVALENQLMTLRPDVEATLSAQIEDELRRQSVRSTLFTVNPTREPPFFRPSLIPGVYFQLGTLPDLLVVAPKNRIQVISSVLLKPGLSPSQIDQLESNADGLGVSSVVTSIGGLAAYPSMLPDTQSVRDLLVTVSHEWTHHYLAFHPLGMSYFTNYEMREINETVADMVGREVGQAVYDRVYAVRAPTLSLPPARAASPQPAKPDFGSLMRETRVAVDEFLSHDDVAGADAYMARRRQVLARDGFYVRKLNTAYLSFFGSYAGGANPYEPKLRQIRANSRTLAAFLTLIEDVQTPSDLDRILAR